MIQLGLYSNEFEIEYWNAVNKFIDPSEQREILASCRKFLPSNFFNESTSEFKSLILAPWGKLKAAESFIRVEKFDEMKSECFSKTNNQHLIMNPIYKRLHDSYSKIANSEKRKASLRVRIVRNAGLTVCPYCNRDYINSRGENVSGAQLDHFFNKSTFPLFSICLYNLVPVCSNCNRVKGKQTITFASPFDSSINWIQDLRFSYQGTTSKDMRILVEAKRSSEVENNITGMRIREAYQIHSIEVLELIEKQQMYNQTQKEELQKVLGQIELTDSEFKKMIFGPEITNESIKTKPLGKLLYDLHKELKIY
ncbi:hypothetical protein [Paenibacillus illinoisensis]|uniref:hypothetical protein n=1 Tax=Paenibacillus illinoisensis TaxID=59845 RepID=UPI00301BB42A